MAKKKKKKPSKGAAFLWRTLFLLLAVGFIAFFILIFLVRKDVFGKLPSTEELAALRNEEATLILSSNGAVIGKVFAEDRTNVHWKDIPSHVVNALVSTEDQRFFEHEGVAVSYTHLTLPTSDLV